NVASLQKRLDQLWIDVRGFYGQLGLLDPRRERPNALRIGLVLVA
ncbi:MAG: hypothetical protein ACI9OJ_001309, partial [Myxococcota bacterium]